MRKLAAIWLDKNRFSGKLKTSTAESNNRVSPSNFEIKNLSVYAHTNEKISSCSMTKRKTLKVLSIPDRIKFTRENNYSTNCLAYSHS